MSSYCRPQCFTPKISYKQRSVLCQSDMSNSCLSVAHWLYCSRQGLYLNYGQRSSYLIQENLAKKGIFAAKKFGTKNAAVMFLLKPIYDVARKEPESSSKHASSFLVHLSLLNPDRDPLTQWILIRIIKTERNINDKRGIIKAVLRIRDVYPVGIPDLRCLSRIPDPNFFHPGSRFKKISKSRIRICISI
jgi:hypothetical protein